MNLPLQVGLAKGDGQGGGAVFDLVGAGHVKHCAADFFYHPGPVPGVLVGLGAVVGIGPGSLSSSSSLPPPISTGLGVLVAPGVGVMMANGGGMYKSRPKRITAFGRQFAVKIS